MQGWDGGRPSIGLAGRHFVTWYSNMVGLFASLFGENYHIHVTYGRGGGEGDAPLTIYGNRWLRTTSITVPFVKDDKDKRKWNSLCKHTPFTYL